MVERMKRLVIIVTLLVVSISVKAEAMDCDDIFNKLSHNSEVLHFSKYIPPKGGSYPSIVIYGATDDSCANYKKILENNSPDFIRCKDGSYLGHLPQGEVTPGMSCFKLKVCFGKQCQSETVNMLKSKDGAYIGSTPKGALLVF